MVKNKNFVGARLSEELKQRFDEHVQGSGKSPTEVVREAISRYINFTPSTIKVDIDWKTDLENRVKALEEKLQGVPSHEIQLELHGDDHKSDINIDINPENNSDIKSDSKEKLWSHKELAAMPEIDLTYSGLKYRHQQGTNVDLPNGQVLEPVRVRNIPRWQVANSKTLDKKAKKQHQPQKR